MITPEKELKATSHLYPSKPGRANLAAFHPILVLHVPFRRELPWRLWDANSGRSCSDGPAHPLEDLEAQKKSERTLRQHLSSKKKQEYPMEYPAFKCFGCEEEMLARLRSGYFAGKALAWFLVLAPK